MPKGLEPLDRLEFAAVALKGVCDLVAAARDLKEVSPDSLSVLLSTIADEIEDSTEELRRQD